MARAVLVSIPHHLTQRGLDRQAVFFGDTDYEVYLTLVQTNARRFGADLLGYCLMPNHVHWVAAPCRPDALARTFGEAHGRYAVYANAKRSRSGHFWQNRFFSCPLDGPHLWAAMRYVERNPVRAGLVERASAFRWSSAGAHTGLDSRPAWLEGEPMRSSFSPEQWELYLTFDRVSEAELQVRQNTYTGRPSGSKEFAEWAESVLGRKLAAQAGGRPRKNSVAGATTESTSQGSFFESW